MEHLSLGKRGEEVAEGYLKKQGFRIRARNWSVKGRDGKLIGELDIVARKGKDVVFVEVKAGSSSNPAWRPEIHMTPWKAQRLIRAAQAWLSTNRKLDSPWRIDVIAVDFLSDTPTVRHFPNALSA